MRSALNNAREYPVKPLIRRAVLFTALWWILAEGNFVAWGVGLVSIMLALATSLILLPPGPSRLSLTGLAGFLGYFLVQSLKGGVQVALMALRPRLDLRPAVVDIPLRLPEGRARVLLAITLNLLPGTLSAGLESRHLRMHVLDERSPVETEVRKTETHIARMLGLPLEAR
ncbi:MAG: Na+/H+ antiporter subunit E [Sulfurimicrobium sp.]|jgi:multicomponent Na+:H+ antiporter subunit E|nr:Na+/H+ antiporter subunit E [Sulfurimicrobium sp.]MDO9189058.1 Na+/H+ antiporter subunit E [Sulfurimicrobium sp.]MDP1705077.1 Na+/H+ antiporter subunit E [Sulfurimicrobium sp.]MDP2198816.1 Na+/H+ antiporter subunit E [Sulfurimicrobium sp.]MDP3687268.1 Na+/H+ antiporter subunit E [Sulfurimicrobium sp.]